MELTYGMGYGELMGTFTSLSLFFAQSMHGQKNSNASKGVEVVDEQEKGFSSPGQENHVTM